MDTSIIDVIFKVLDYLFDLSKYTLPVLSALLAVVITQSFVILNDKNKQKWEKQKSHRDFLLEIKKTRIEQTEDFIKKSSISYWEVMADILGLQLVTTQEELDKYYLKLEKDLDNDSSDPESLGLTYLSVVRSFGDKKLDSLLDQIIEMGLDIGDKWKQFFITKPGISYVLSKQEEIQNIYDFRDKYRKLLSDIFQRLEIIYKESDPFLNS